VKMEGVKKLFDNMLIPTFPKDINHRSESKLKEIKKECIEFLMRYFKSSRVGNIKKANSEFGSWRVYIKDQKNRYSDLADYIEKIEDAVVDFVRGMRKKLEPSYRI